MSENTNSITSYIQVVLLSLLIYIACMLVSETPIVDTIIDDVLLILLSVIIVYFCNEGYDLLMYGLYLVLFILVLTFMEHYAFIVAVSLLSMICIECVRKINNNDRDYQLIKENENGL